MDIVRKQDMNFTVSNKLNLKFETKFLFRSSLLFCLYRKLKFENRSSFGSFFFLRGCHPSASVHIDKMDSHPENDVVSHGTRCHVLHM